MFVERCERNPALYTRCTLLWWDAWSDAAMRDVAGVRLSQAFAGVQGFSQLVDAMLQIHGARPSATPRDFITFVDTYRKVPRHILAQLQGMG